jgi:hypothetical protein
MELRGIAGVVAPNDIKPGLFYLRTNGDGGSWLCLRIGRNDDQHEPRIWDVVFDRPDRHGIFFSEPDDYEPVVALPPVSIRIDRASLSGNQFSTTFRPPLIAVVGKEVFVQATGNRHGSLTFSLASGMVVSRPSDWVAFSRWSLVIDDGDDEITLCSYGD